MLPILEDFEVVHPRTAAEAARALAEAGAAAGGAMIVAGGTDLVPNLKHGLFAPRRLVSLRLVDELRRARETPDGGIVVGAGVRLADLAANPSVRAGWPALARAASLVAGPQLRNMGTLGGNLCLDTRCVYYNQTFFWRRALGFCLKKDGDVCHVVPGGRRCVAALSADTPAPLVVYGARVRLVSSRGTREVVVEDFFTADGTANTVRAPDEILTEVVLPPPADGLRAAYVKLRPREAIDFPTLGVAAAATAGPDGALRGAAVVVVGLGAKPRRVTGLDDIARGRPLGPAVVDAIAERAWRACHPLPNIGVDPAWRREVLPVLVRRAFGALEGC